MKLKEERQECVEILGLDVKCGKKAIKGGQYCKEHMQPSSQID